MFNSFRPCNKPITDVGEGRKYVSKEFYDATNFKLEKKIIRYERMKCELLAFSCGPAVSAFI